MSTTSDFSNIFSAFAAVSAFLSGVVVLTGFVFPRMLLCHTRPFSNIIFFISFCDMMGSIGSSFGFVTNGSAKCRTQSFLFLYFMPCSWAWTTMLVFQLRCAMVHKRLWLTMPWVHLICWGFPLLLALLPLTTNTYGQDDEVNGKSPCAIGKPKDTDYLWTIFDFSAFFWICSAIMIISIAHISFHLRATASDGPSPTDSILYRTTLLYPIFMLVLWIPNMVTYYVIAMNQAIGDTTLQALEIIYTQNGTFLALIFFVSSRQVRLAWRRLLGRLCERARNLCAKYSTTNESLRSRPDRDTTTSVSPGPPEFASTDRAPPHFDDEVGDDLKEDRWHFFETEPDGPSRSSSANDNPMHSFSAPERSVSIAMGPISTPIPLSAAAPQHECQNQESRDRQGAQESEGQEEREEVRRAPDKVDDRLHVDNGFKVDNVLSHIVDIDLPPSP